MAKPTLIVIIGPTASGKTDLAVKVAKKYDGEVIQADSRTVYKHMDIGTAKPEGERRRAAEVRLEDIAGQGIHAKHPKVEMKDLFEEKPLMVEGVPHWGIDIVEPSQDFTTAQFKAYAEKKIFDISERGKIPILAGGTGLYVQAVVDNLKLSDAPPNLELRAQLEELTNEVLAERLRQLDPEAAETIDTENRRRALRAIEIVESTGKKLSEQQIKGEQKFDSLMIGIDVDREPLYERIDARVDEMVARGLVDEVRALRDEFGCDVNAMTGIGYRQICAFLEGYMKLKDAIELIKRDSRHYAKRQLTWFRRDHRIKWVKSEEEALMFVAEFLSQVPLGRPGRSLLS